MSADNSAQIKSSKQHLYMFVDLLPKKLWFLIPISFFYQILEIAETIAEIGCSLKLILYVKK